MKKKKKETVLTFIKKDEYGNQIGVKVTLSEILTSKSLVAIRKFYEKREYKETTRSKNQKIKVTK